MTFMVCNTVSDLYGKNTLTSKFFTKLTCLPAARILTWSNGTVLASGSGIFVIVCGIKHAASHFEYLFGL